MEESHQSGNRSTGKGGSISASVGSSDGDDGGSLFMSAGLTSASSAADFVNY